MSDKNYLKRTVIKESISSRYLDEERSVRIFLPPGYNELISYPIVYTQDGQDAFMYGRIATIANYLILEKGMEPIIIVGVDVDKKKRSSEYSPLGSRNEAYKRFFVEELCPFIESRYPLRQNGMNRILLGDSLGATVCLHMALDHPDWFQYVISLSGAFLNPTLAELSRASDLGWLNIWMLIGTEETEVETHAGTFNFLDWNRRAKSVLEQKGANLTYLEKKGKHIWGFWQKHLPDALMHYFGSNI
ncbi:esterase [Caldalkalibacillus thermarum TA2.A1]|uniref:Esterase n=1 Tax=Caldalkalibacillus thermarum (strain TA2.A1) TaxID=986075 RepID=F5L7R6_CALTT|nr:alpha/beta hydrolase-fold protein [Caldalkalibacillus thermarum]EGL82642.1 esterase [Caldalkalibacillus thermarum TA2.A1]QZT33347.1 esterase family protein [Caldalkalibacillus thermarum TA2.A1]